MGFKVQRFKVQRFKAQQFESWTSVSTFYAGFSVIAGPKSGQFSRKKISDMVPLGDHLYHGLGR